MLPWIEAIKNENGQHYCNQTFTVWSRLSLTNFGTPQNRSQWELGLQIIISCSYVTYEWCVQAILRYLPWSMKNYTCSGEDSGSAEQVFFLELRPIPSWNWHLSMFWSIVWDYNDSASGSCSFPLGVGTSNWGGSSAGIGSKSVVSSKLCAILALITTTQNYFFFNFSNYFWQMSVFFLTLG